MQLLLRCLIRGGLREEAYEFFFLISLLDVIFSFSNVVLGTGWDLTKCDSASMDKNLRTCSYERKEYRLSNSYKNVKGIGLPRLGLFLPEEN